MSGLEEKIRGHPEIIITAARVRAISEQEILRARSTLDAAFSTPKTPAQRTEEAKTYAAIREQYLPLIADAKQLQAAEFPDTYGHVVQLLGGKEEGGLLGAMHDAKLRLDVHACTLAEQMRTLLARGDTAALKEAHRLYASEKEMLLLTGEPSAKEAAQTLAAMIDVATSRARDAARQKNRRDETAQAYHGRLDTLEEEFSTEKREREAISPKGLGWNAYRKARELRARSAMLSQHANALEEEVLANGTEEQQQRVRELRSSIQEGAIEAKRTYQLAGKYHRESVFRRLAIATGATLLGGMILKGASYVPDLMRHETKAAVAAEKAPSAARGGEGARTEQTRQAEKGHESAAPQPAPSIARPSKEYTLERAIAQNPNATSVLYLSRDAREGTLYSVEKSGPIPIYHAKCTFSRNQGNKERAGDNRTQEGIFPVESYVWLGEGGDPLYGNGCLNLEDKPYPGLQVTGASLPERVAAIRRGVDATNGAASFLNEDFAKIYNAVKEQGKNLLVIIEEKSRPLYR